MGDSQNVCQSPNCNKLASLRCPHCLKLGINSYYCSQDCFKKNYREHKKIHGPDVNIQKNASTYCPWPNFTFTGRLRPYPTTPLRTVPANILRPDYADSPTGVSLSEMEESCTNVIKVLDAEEIEGMRVACKLAREVLDEAVKACAVGVTTDAVDNLVHEACIERECYPSPLNYYNFPKSCCTSINEIICHGIPDLRPLQNGDICNLDITVYHRGYHGDVNETIFIGEVDSAAKHLVKTCYECLDKSINLVKPGVKYRDLGEVIQRHADQNGLSVVKSYCGHGIHKLFHCNPRVPHYARNRSIGVMRQGHVFTIEPMINEGTWRDVLWPDSWTAATEDGKRSAQFEHTLLVTENGCDVLTARHNGTPWFMEQK